MSDPAEAARLRELQRRAFARPRTPEEEADAAAAAAELAALRPPAARVAARGPGEQPRDGGAPGDHDVEAHDDDERDDRSWLDSAAAAARARVQRSSRGERRAVVIGAAALVLLTGILVAVHASLTAPPPAYAVFDSGAPSTSTTGGVDTTAQTVRTQLQNRGLDIVAGPHLFGEPTRDPRLAVYLQWVSPSITEVCAGIVLEGALLTGESCTSEQAFRESGIEGVFDDGAYSVEYSWSPSGEPRVELVQRGAVTLEEVRELGIPALAALETAPTPAEDLIWNYTPDTIAGPLLLAEIEGAQYVGLLAGDDDSFGRLGDAPAFCLWVGDPQSNAGTCTTAEDFAANGIEGPTGSGFPGSDRAVRWLPSGELVVEEP